MNEQRISPSYAQILTVASAFFLEVLDATIMIVAIIPMASNLGASISDTTLSLASYLLALVLFTPLSATLLKTLALADKFQAGLVIFCAGSLICALSQDLYLLCIGRLIQGLGSALIVPAGRALILANTLKPAIPKTMAWLITPALTAPMVAPYIANLIISVGNWRLIFVFIALFAVGLMIACRRLLFTLPRPATPHPPLDYYAYSLWALAACALFITFLASSKNQMDDALMAATVMLISAVALYKKTRSPSRKKLFDLSLFSSWAFKLNIVSGSLFRISIYAFPTLLIINLMTSSSFSVTSIGHCLAFIFAGNFLSKPAAVKVLSGGTYLKHYLIGSALATTLTLSVFLIPSLIQQLPALWLCCFLHGCARSFQFLGYSSISLREVGPTRMHHATVLMGSVMQLNALIGQAVPALLMALFIPQALTQDSSTVFFRVGIGTLTALVFITVLTALFLPSSSKVTFQSSH